MNRYAQKLAAAIEWMGPRYIGHPDCPKHNYCPDRVKLRERTMLDHTTDDELVHYAQLGLTALTTDQAARLAEIAQARLEGYNSIVTLLERTEPYLADCGDTALLDELYEVLG